MWCSTRSWLALTALAAVGLTPGCFDFEEAPAPDAAMARDAWPPGVDATAPGLDAAPSELDAYVPPGVDASLDAGPLVGDAATDAGHDAGSSPDPDAGTPPSEPWYRPVPTCTRERYAAPVGEGLGLTPPMPTSLAIAIATAQAGDCVWLLDGTYSGNRTISPPSTPGPVVYRAVAGATVRFTGSIRITADETWLWGVELDGSSSFSGAPLVVEANDVTLIGNRVTQAADKVLLEHVGDRGLLAYGNVFLGGAGGIFSTGRHTGANFVVHNVVLDTTGDDAALYASSTSGVRALHVEGNVFANRSGRTVVMIGGRGDTADADVVIRGNHLYSTDLALGISRPIQAEVSMNRLWGSLFEYRYLWGQGDTRFADLPPTRVSRNTFYGRSPTDTLVDVRTAAFAGGSVATGLPALRPADVWDENTYGPTFRGDLYAGGGMSFSSGLPSWRDETAGRGNRFDASSTAGAPPTSAYAELLADRYDPDRAYLVVYGYSYTGSELATPLDLTSTFRVGDVVDAFDLRAPHAPPLGVIVVAESPTAIPVTSPFDVYVLSRRP